MDTSEQYIKMCEEAVEIQKISPNNKSREWFICPICHYILSEDQSSYWCDEHGFVHAIWLPRQDQLQEMLLEKKQSTLLTPLEKMLLEFDQFIHPGNYCIHGEREPGFYHQGYCEFCNKQVNSLNQFTSLEQLWMAFYYKEIHNKVWNGEDWVLS